MGYTVQSTFLLIDLPYALVILWSRAVATSSRPVILGNIWWLLAVAGGLAEVMRLVATGGLTDSEVAAINIMHMSCVHSVAVNQLLEVNSLQLLLL